jgi:hypothetical protein
MWPISSSKYNSAECVQMWSLHWCFNKKMFQFIFLMACFTGKNFTDRSGGTLQCVYQVCVSLLENASAGHAYNTTITYDDVFISQPPLWPQLFTLGNHSLEELSVVETGSWSLTHWSLSAINAEKVGNSIQDGRIKKQAEARSQGPGL